LLTMSRAILEKATAQKELLVKLGMSEPVLDELTTALGQYEDTRLQPRTTRGVRERELFWATRLKLVGFGLSNAPNSSISRVRWRIPGSD
jgi:hypothetical protein